RVEVAPDAFREYAGLPGAVLAVDDDSDRVGLLPCHRHLPLARFRASWQKKAAPPIGEPGPIFSAGGHLRSGPHEVLGADQGEGEYAAGKRDDRRDQQDAVQPAGEGTPGDADHLLTGAWREMRDGLSDGARLDRCRDLSAMTRESWHRMNLRGDEVDDAIREKRSLQGDSGRDADLPERRVDPGRHPRTVRTDHADRRRGEWRVEHPDA